MAPICEREQTGPAQRRLRFARRTPDRDQSNSPHNPTDRPGRTRVMLQGAISTHPMWPFARTRVIPIERSVASHSTSRRVPGLREIHFVLAKRSGCRQDVSTSFGVASAMTACRVVRNVGPASAACRLAGLTANSRSDNFHAAARIVIAAYQTFLKPCIVAGSATRQALLAGCKLGRSRDLEIESEQRLPGSIRHLHPPLPATPGRLLSLVE